MFSGLFRQRAKAQKTLGAGTPEKTGDGNVVFTEASVAAVKRDMDESQYMFSYPELVDGMSDHVKSHRRGKEFQYATLVEGIPETTENLLSRLRSFKPPGGMTTTTADKMPKINLTGSFHSLKLSQATDYLSTKKMPFKFSKEFILLSEILLTFVPLISFGDKFSAFKVAIVDNRKVDDVVVRSYTGNTNISCNASMSLDYCVSMDDLNDLELVFVCPQPTLKQGKVWAVVNVHLILKQFDFPVQSYVKPTFSIFQIPHSGLEDVDTDPRHFNGLIQEADLDAMKQIKSDGDMTDVSKPHVKTMAKSALAGTAYAGGQQAKPKIGRITEIASDKGSQDSGYLPCEDGDEEEEPPYIKRLKESALRDQREAQDLDPYSAPQESKDSVSVSNAQNGFLKSAMKKSDHQRNLSGSTINEQIFPGSLGEALGTRVNTVDVLEIDSNSKEKLKKMRFISPPASARGDQGDEDLSHLD